MKLKNIVAFFSIFLMLVLVGCEDSTMIKSAFFTNNTSAGSEVYVVKLTFQQDERLKDKYFDVLVKCDKAVQLSFGEENQEKVVINFEKENYWESLTNLLSIANDKEGEESFIKFEDALAKTYLITSESECTLTFRAVVGDLETNEMQTGSILVGIENISEEFELKIK